MSGAAPDDASLAEVAAQYRVFAEQEAKGVSPLYEALCLAVAESEPLLRFVAALPKPKRQPNLVLAAVRRRHGLARDGERLAELVAGDGEGIRALILSRSTQTNEPGRCATLLPALARLPGPLALLEVGASAGLCLLPDRYAYDYGGARLAPTAKGAHPPPVFPCRASEETPIPERMPLVVWRAGLDLDPLDLADPEEAAWLETLVWPGQEGRAERLRAAMDVARADPPRVLRGDLVDDLPALAAEAPSGATLVVFHSAVLVYVAPERRARFREVVRGLGAVWIANESPPVLPDVAAKLRRRPPFHRFLLSVDGEPLALTGPHGQSIDWLG